MITLRTANWHDAEEVLANLSAITRADLEAHAMDDEAVRATLKLYFSTGAVHVMLDGDKPLCVAGLTVIQDEWLLWLIGAEGFWSSRPAIWRILRRYHQTVLPAIGEPIHCWSASPHPRLRRWFEVLGYDYAGTEGELQHFIYPA